QAVPPSSSGAFFAGAFCSPWAWSRRGATGVPNSHTRTPAARASRTGNSQARRVGTRRIEKLLRDRAAGSVRLRSRILGLDQRGKREAPGAPPLRWMSAGAWRDRFVTLTASGRVNLTGANSPVERPGRLLADGAGRKSPHSYRLRCSPGNGPDFESFGTD